MDLVILSQTLDLLPQGMLLIDVQQADFPIVFVNKVYEQRSGIAAADLLHRPCRSLLPAPASLDDQSVLENAFQTGIATKIVQTSHHSDNAPTWYEIVFSPLPTETTPAYYLGVQHDITEQITLHRELSFMDSSLHNAREVIIVADETGRIIRANRTSGERLGYTWAELNQMYMFDLDPGLTRESWPDTWALFQQKVTLVRETVNRTKSGRDIPVEVSINYFEYRGNGYITAFARDLTPRKKSEEALKASEARLQAIVKNLPFDLWVKDRDNRFLLQNEPSIKRWGNLIGKHNADTVLAPAILALWEEEDQAALAGSLIRKEVRYEQTDPPRYYQKIISPIWLEDEIIGTVGVNVEITEQVLAQQALRESEERLSLALRAANIGTWEWQLQTDELHWSEQVGQILGMDQKAGFPVTFETYRGLIYPEDQVLVEEKIAAALSGQSSNYEVVHRVRLPNGNLLWVEGKGRVYRDKHGQPIRMMGTVTDISDRRKAQIALEESEERLRSLVENMPILVDAFDESWRVVLWNKECERVTGYRTEEMQAHPQALELLYPDAEYRERMMAGWQMRGNDFRDWEWQVACKDGTVKTIAWSNIAQSLPIPGYATWGVGVDVTQRKQAENALRISQERYQAISELVSDFAYSYRIEPSGMGVQEWITDAFTRVMGYQPEEALTSNDWRRMVHPDELESFIAGQAALASGENGVWEFRMLAKDGHIIWLRFYSRPVWDEAEGRVVRIYGAAQDITQVKQLEEQLLQAQKMEAIGRLAGGVAHDFNNLLTVILSYGDLLVRRSTVEGGDLKVMGRWGQQIKQAAERAAALTNQLLAFSRQQVLELQVLNLNDVVRHMTDMLRRIIGEDVRLQTFLASDLGQVRADLNQIEQVVLNLVVNGRDAMPQGGILAIETGNVFLDETYSRQHVDVAPGPYVMVAVSDTGVGITTSTISRIFEPFFTTKERGKGTGLGLATVHGIIKQSGGHVAVYSEVERGTTFKVYLPRVDERAKRSKPNPVPQLTAQGQETILLVEDEQMVRALAQDILTLYGYEVLAASSEEAEQLCQGYEGTIDLLLTDVVMPVISGRELAERLTVVRPHLKVLYMSGYTDNIILHHGVLKPGIAFLQKPFTPEGLVRKVRSVLDGT